MAAPHPVGHADLHHAGRASIGCGHHRDRSELVGVKDFHKIPAGTVAGQIEAVATDIGFQAAKTGMLASSEIIEAVADTWRGSGNPAGVPRRRSSSTRCAHPCTAIHRCIRQPEAFRTSLFPLATLVTPNLDEVRLLVGADVVDGKTNANAARALPAGPEMDPREGAATCGRPRTARTSCTTAPTSTNSTRHASAPPRPRRRRHAEAPPSPVPWHTASRCPTRSPSARPGSPSVCAPPIRSAAGMGRCRRCSGWVNDRPDAIAGIAHRPEGQPNGVQSRAWWCSRTGRR